MLETKQKIPEFLKQFEPEGDDRENLKFESEDQLESAFGMGDESGGAWGGGGGESSGDAWGSGGGGGEPPGNAWGGGDAAGAGAANADAWGAGGASGGW